MSALRRSSHLLQQLVGRGPVRGYLDASRSAIAAAFEADGLQKHFSTSASAHQSMCACPSCSRLGPLRLINASQRTSAPVSTLPSASSRPAHCHCPRCCMPALISQPVRHYATEGKDTQEAAEAGPADQAEAGGEQQHSVEELLAHKAELSEKVEKLTDQVKRALAETENVRMRSARDLDAAKKFAIQGFVKSILDVADNLERAAAAVPPNALSEEPGAPAPDAAQLRALLKGLLEGVSATERILLNIFKQNGIEQYNPLGDKFDPNLHNALFQIPDPSKEVGTVASVTKRGYKLHDRVVRPADVGVVRAP